MASLTTTPEEDNNSIETPAASGLQTDLPQAVETTNNREIYSVEIQNNGTLIKVFMPPHMHQAMASINQKQKKKQQPYSKRPRIENQSNKSQDKMKGNDVDRNSANTATTNEESPAPEADTAVIEIPESVRQYERQLRKMQAATRASTELSPDDLQIVYNDPHIVVVNKPSGFLTVPGVNNNPNLLSLVYKTLLKQEPERKILEKLEKMEHMIVHRLDMDTSGLVMFAKTKESMAQLQANFRQGTMDQTNNKKKKRWKNRKKESRPTGGAAASTSTSSSPPPSVDKPIQKEYEALLCGHLTPASLQTIQIDLPLQRDHEHPPFMRVATPTSELEAQEVVKGLNHAGWKKIVKKKAKPSQTILQVLNREYVVRTKEVVKKEQHGNKNNGALTTIDGSDSPTIGEQLPVTRVRLIPVTGRTHQLRVHCAAIGHPILADPTYGILGEASPNGGFDTCLLDQAFIKTDDASGGSNNKRASSSTKLQLQLDQWVKDHEQVMCLHARKLQLNHPITGEELCLEEAPKFWRKKATLVTQWKGLPRLNLGKL